VRPVRYAATLLGAVLVLSCGDGGDGRRDLLLVTVDTLRADRLGAYGSGLGLSPHLDELASESLVFSHAFSTASYTLPAVISLLTGRLPDELGIRANVSVFRGDVPTLATRLWNQGWSTGAVVSNAILKRRVGIHAGFERYDDALPQWERNRSVPERIAADTTDAALAMLESLHAEGDGPVFLWIHYQDPHGPYAPPPGYRERYLEPERRAPDGARRLPIDESQVGDAGIPAYQRIGDEREVGFYRAGYDGEIRYVDEEVGRLLRSVRERELMDEPVVVFTADHGEGLGEDDYWFAHGEYLTDPIVRVPLFVRAPGLAPARRDDVASLIDLVPTITRLVGADPPVGYPGRDLLAPGASSESSRALLTTGRISKVPREGLVSGGYHYLVSLTESGPRERLFRVGRPDREIGSERGDLLDALRAEHLELKQRHRAGSEELRALEPEELRQLEALGYLRRPAAAQDAPSPEAGEPGPDR
jgi:arylsulfatase